MSVKTTHVARLGMGTTIAAMCLAAVSAQLPADAPTRVALYAGVGEELITFGVDVERATLTRESSLMHGFATDKEGNLYTAEVRTGRVQKYTPRKGATRSSSSASPGRASGSSSCSDGPY